MKRIEPTFEDVECLSAICEKLTEQSAELIYSAGKRARETLAEIKKLKGDK